MSISYIAIGEWVKDNGMTHVEHAFFTTDRVRTESPKKIAEADAWASQKLKEHGTQRCRMTIAKVIWSING